MQTRKQIILLVTLLLMGGLPFLPAATDGLQAILSREIIGPKLAMTEVQNYLEPRVPRIPTLRTEQDWNRYADRVRAGVLQRVVFRGEAARWRKAKTKVEWLDAVAGGPGYRIKKLRYEALPGLWIPALLYEPESLSGKVPVILNVNGHDGNGKAAGYKQIRCINQAKRGMLALNVEWFGMGQLRGADFGHYRMNQLDLCGTSGLSPFYLNMARGLDVLLSLPNADPKRVAVTGLSGGGWQTIFISALDTRVKLTNPVAGYSSFLTRVRHLKDLGDSEQTPCDLATVADYTHLTAMMSPRAALLTYNSKDDCCFESGYALPPLMEAALPIFKLFRRENALRSHVNDDPGTHNYERDNRQAFYRMVGDHFYAGRNFEATEISSDAEVKTAEQLAVELPAQNENFNSLALALSKNLPRDSNVPTNPSRRWQCQRRAKLREVVRAKNYDVEAEKAGGEEKDSLAVMFWRLNVSPPHTAGWKPALRSNAWTIPAVELSRGKPNGTTILIADGGRRSVAAQVEALLATGQRVLAVDPFYFGESKIEQRDFLFALLVAAVGDRPLGLQASQVVAVARWAQKRDGKPVTVRAIGPRTSLVALVAAGLEDKAVGRLELRGSLRSLKELIEQNRGVDQMPEMFCFGLLKEFDVPQLTALVRPRPVALTLRF
jgi:dienelactone hydrolase